MESTDTAATVPVTAEARIQDLERLLASKSAEVSELAAFKSQVDGEKRAKLAEMQPAVAEFVNQIISTAGEHASELTPMREWSNNLDKSENLTTALPLARLVSCASATLKRTREDASVADSQTKLLAEASQQNDIMAKQLKTSQMKYDELVKRCDELVASNEALAKTVDQYGLAQSTQAEFSKLSTRIKESSGDDAARAPTAATSTSFKPDDLMTFITTKAGPASNRVTPSSTGHAFVGGGPSRDAQYAAMV